MKYRKLRITWSVAKHHLRISLRLSLLLIALCSVLFAWFRVRYDFRRAEAARLRAGLELDLKTRRRLREGFEQNLQEVLKTLKSENPKVLSRQQLDEVRQAEYLFFEADAETTRVVVKLKELNE